MFIFIGNYKLFLISQEDYKKSGLSTDFTELDYISIFNYLRWVSNNRGLWHHKPYDWLIELEFINLDETLTSYLKDRKLRSNRLKQRFESALPSLLKKERAFAQFLLRPDFDSFNNLRWKDVLSSYNYSTQWQIKQEQEAPIFVMPPVAYRGLVKPIMLQAEPVVKRVIVIDKAKKKNGGTRKIRVKKLK